MDVMVTLIDDKQKLGSNDQRLATKLRSNLLKPTASMHACRDQPSFVQRSEPFVGTLFGQKKNPWEDEHVRSSREASSAVVQVDASPDSFEVLQVGKKLSQGESKMVLPWYS